MSYRLKISKTVESKVFPDVLAPDSVKKTDEYGLKFAKAIESQWFYRNGDGKCEYYSRADKYHNLRLYARGEQSVKRYKDMLTDGKETYANYDFRPLQIAPKFVKLLSNQMTERLFNIKAEAIDKYSTNLRDKYKQQLEKKMHMKPFLQDAEQKLGIEVMSEDERMAPESDEELDLQMSLKYKPAIEIATEEAIKTTLELNNYDETQRDVVEDVVVLGMGVVKHYSDPIRGIVVDYVDPANFIHSFVRKKDFSDAHYFGEVKQITINELKRLSNGKFTDEQLREVSGSTLQWNKYHDMERSGYNYDDINNNIVNILDFTFKSTKTITYKKKFNKNGGYKLIKKDETFDKKNNHTGYDVVKKVIDVWYKGTFVLGTNYIFNYGLEENMIRPKGFINKTLPKYVAYAPEMYQNRTKSLVERIVPYIDGMQQIHIKLQALIAKAKPNGIYIDVDGLEEIDMGDGNFLTPLEVLRIYNDTGNVIGTNKTTGGDYNYGREPIKELKNGIVDGLDRLIMAYNQYLTLLRDAIGVPAGADASMPHPDTLVGVQKQVLLNSNIATRHILDSMLNISKYVGKGIALRLKYIFKYSNLKELYINAIGKYNVDIIKALNEYNLYDLGLNIELKPDVQEQQNLENNIQLALQTGAITLDDAIDIRNIGNLKLANQLIKIRRRKREEVKRKEAENLEKIRGDSQLKIQQQISQNKQMEFKLKLDASLQEIDAKAKAKAFEIEAEKRAKAELMEKEFNYNMTLKGIDVQHDMYNKKLEKQNKLDAIDRQSTNDSKKIEQKEYKLPSINFESSEDNITGSLDMGELEPH